MISIDKAGIRDFQLLANIGRLSYIESHGSSASIENVNKYVNEKFNRDVLKEELCDPGNIYHIIYHEKQPAGYSKIILNSAHSDIMKKNVTKLERLYLLKEFYNLKLGFELLEFNIDLSRSNSQLGMWLYVWKKNHRAVSFYKKNGFKIIGTYDFKITASHSNPNYHMLLEY